MLTLTICGLQFGIEQLEFRNAAVKVRIMVLVVPNQSSNASGVDSQMLDRNVMMGQPCPIVLLSGVRFVCQHTAQHSYFVGVSMLVFIHFSFLLFEFRFLYKSQRSENRWLNCFFNCDTSLVWS